MTTQDFGLVRTATGTATLQSIPVPRIRSDHILVRTVAIALNPTDWTTLDAVGDNGTLVGCDYAGIIEQVGADVTSGFQKGDRNAGFAHGGNDADPETGAFSRYITVKGDIQLHMPPPTSFNKTRDTSFEDAATATVGLFSAGYALYKVLKLAWPIEAAIGK